MKLKKIASLMLAGIMAVSMLAGCKSGTTTPDDNSSSSEVVNVSNAAAGINAQLDKAKDVISFTGNEELANAVKNFYKNNPFKADEWSEKTTGRMWSCTDSVDSMLNVTDRIAGDGMETWLGSEDDNSKTTGLVVYGFNQHNWTLDGALKVVGNAIDDADYAEDFASAPDYDSKKYSYSGNAEVIEVKSENGEVSMWVVAVLITKDYVNR